MITKLERVKYAASKLRKNGESLLQRDIAVDLGYSRESTISEVFNGKVPISRKFVRNFCQTYGVSQPWVETGLEPAFIPDGAALKGISFELNDAEGNGAENNNVSRQNLFGEEADWKELYYAELKYSRDAIARDNQTIQDTAKAAQDAAHSAREYVDSRLTAFVPRREQAVLLGRLEGLQDYLRMYLPSLLNKTEQQLVDELDTLQRKRVLDQPAIRDSKEGGDR